MDELDKLDSIAKDSWYNKGANRHTIHYSADICMRHFYGGDVLELGPAEGEFTSRLVERADSLTLVDGSSIFCNDLKQRYPQATVINTLFEEVDLTGEYDLIVLGHVLEHVDDPVFVLSHIRKFLKPGGQLFAAVPNARSLHRQAAVLMGLLGSLYELNESDIHHGHKRVFNTEAFRECFIEAGYVINVFGGYWLKPVSNKQIDEDWSDEMLKAFMELGELYPDIAGEIYAVASNKK
ncbi:MAG: class I SAM-dependent methyltransferase [Candidatus Pacearchaeota archaeon]|nr:class I SAM-dependent methyltransferase [Candidatus Pacearchaeota archaeon]